MPRTEKRFGVVNQPTASTPTELVPTATTTRNVLINATARTSAAISAAIYSGAYSNDATGNVSISAGASINLSNYSTIGANSVNSFFPFGKYAGGNVFVWTTTGSSGLAVVDQATGSARYVGPTQTQTGGAYWRQNLDDIVNFKEANAGGLNYGSPRLNNSFVAVSSTDAIGIGVSMSTSPTAGQRMFDKITYTHTVGTSITESGNGFGDTALQGVGDVGRHGGGANALQDGVGYLFHHGTTYIYQTTTGRVGLGLYIYSSSSSTFGKRAYWNCDGTANKTAGYALAYFICSDYNSTNQVFAFSQPSTTTLWSGISPTSSTSWPSGYTLPSAAAPAGFRIVSNSNTVSPTDTNFLTGTITYPEAPTGVNVPDLSVNRSFQVCALKFSPDNTRLAVAYSRNYSGTGDAESVVVVYTRQNDGSWVHTHSSGSAIRYMPDNPDCMAWSTDGGYIAVVANTSTSISQTTQNTTPIIDRWAVGSGVGNSSIANSTITSWTVASSKYPDFLGYIAPNTGSSAVVSIATSSSSTLGATSNNFSIRGCTFTRNLSTEAGTMFAAIDNVVASSGTRVLQGIIMQPLGTVGVSGQTATNYVTTVISDLALTPGQTSQVSNIVLGSGERVFVESSTSNSVDISAHGIEST